MTGMKDLEATIARLDEAYERVRDATREANSATKEMRGVIWEGRELVRDIDARAKSTVESFVAPAIEAILREIVKGTNRAVADSTEHVASRIERAANTALYGNAQGVGPTIFEEMREQLVKGNQTMRRLMNALDAAERKLDGAEEAP